MRVERGRVRVLHVHDPYTGDELQTPPASAATLARAYLDRVDDDYGIEADMLAVPGGQLGAFVANEGDRLRLVAVKPVHNCRVVVFQQSFDGIPVHAHQVVAHTHEHPRRVTSSFGGIARGLSPDVTAPLASGGPSDREIRARVGQLAGLIGKGRAKILRIGLEIRRFDASVPRATIAPHLTPNGIPLPSLGPNIEDGAFYVVHVIRFRMPHTPQHDVAWDAVFELESGDVLSVWPRVAANAWGWVFDNDPVSSSGDLTLKADSNLSAEAVERALVLKSPPQLTSTEHVAFSQVSAPTDPTPVSPDSSSPYGFNVMPPAAEFTAVSALYHLEWFYTMVKDLGFDTVDYFGMGGHFPTAFQPVPCDTRIADHFSYYYPPDPGTPGLERYEFGHVENGEPIGHAASPRVVAHEFGHALIAHQIGQASLPWVHGVGDALAAILFDAGSKLHDETLMVSVAAPTAAPMTGADQEPARFATYPWGRRGSNDALNRWHNRDWQWGDATHDDKDYGSTQILATCLFKAYRAMMGDSGSEAEQLYGARFLSYLIIAAVKKEEVPGTQSAGEFLSKLIAADEGIDPAHVFAPAHTFWKVLVWAFLEQGLDDGDPKEDVFIDDGRNGTYEYQQNFWSSPDIWNRNTAPMDPAHQAPIVGQPNFIFVRVKNRGTVDATDVKVKVFTCAPGTGLVWPSDWTPATTPELAAAGPIPPGGEAIVGPFTWTPAHVGHECLMASVSSAGDDSNLEHVTGSVPHWRLVPYDNNIAQRNVVPVAAGGPQPPTSAASEMEDAEFTARNPEDRSVELEIETEIPDWMRDKGGELRAPDLARRTFHLGPRGSRSIRLDLNPGRDWEGITDDRIAESRLRVVVRIDGIVVGGMDYELDPDRVLPHD